MIDGVYFDWFLISVCFIKFIYICKLYFFYLINVFKNYKIKYEYIISNDFFIFVWCN